MITLLIFYLSFAKLAFADLRNDEFAQEALLAHNLYRKIHGVQDLKLNKELCSMALYRANELAKLENLNVRQNTFKGKKVGETVGAVGGFVEYNGISATQLWYRAVSKYDEEGEFSNEGASFTQIVWKETTEVGFGIAKGNDEKFYFVAEYFPTGNIRGQYEENVFQLSDELINNKNCSNENLIINSTLSQQNLIDSSNNITKNFLIENDESFLSLHSTSTSTSSLHTDAVTFSSSVTREINSILTVLTTTDEKITTTLMVSTERPLQNLEETTSSEIFSKTEQVTVSSNKKQVTSPVTEEVIEETPESIIEEISTTTVSTKKTKPISKLLKTKSTTGVTSTTTASTTTIVKITELKKENTTILIEYEID